MIRRCPHERISSRFQDRTPQFVPLVAQRNGRQKLRCFSERLSRRYFISRRRRVLFEFRPDSKMEGYHRFLVEHRQIWSSNKFIAFFDDDLECDGDKLNQLFQICAEEQLKLAQPSLTRDSYFGCAMCLQQNANFAL